MSWFFERHKRLSDKNGVITIQREFGEWKVLVDTYGQTSGRLNEIWSNAFVRAKPFTPDAKRVLILGLGGGGMLKYTYQAYPHCHITAVEHDSEMIRLTKYLKLYEPFLPPEIVEADAGQALHQLPHSYDLIVVDLFKGGTPSPLLLEENFILVLKEKMGAKGVLLINVAAKEEYLNLASSHFSHGATWVDGANHVGMFRNVL